MVTKLIFLFGLNDTCKSFVGLERLLVNRLESESDRLFVSLRFAATSTTGLLVFETSRKSDLSFGVIILSLIRTVTRFESLTGTAFSLSDSRSRKVDVFFRLR